MSSLRDKEGRTRRKVREMLERLGFTDVRLWPQMGAWRTDKRLDVYAFEGCLSRTDKHGRSRDIAVCSWDTMTAIVQSGGVVVEEDDMFSLMLSPASDGVSRILDGDSHGRRRHV